MTTLEHAISERTHELDEAQGHHHYPDDAQVNIRINAHVAAAIDGVSSALQLGSRTAAARFIVSTAVFDALEQLGLTLEVGEEGGWFTVPKGQSRHDRSQELLSEIATKSNAE
jgi:hypothetical protein